MFQPVTMETVIINPRVKTRVGWMVSGSVEPVAMVTAASFSSWILTGILMGSAWIFPV